MKTVFRIIATNFVIAGLGAALGGLGAALAASPPAASRYYPLVGHWKGRGRLAEAGKAPISLAIRVTCSKAAAGWRSAAR